MNATKAARGRTLPFKDTSLEARFVSGASAAGGELVCARPSCPYSVLIFVFGNAFTPELGSGISPIPVLDLHNSFYTNTFTFCKGFSTSSSPARVCSTTSLQTTGDEGIARKSPTL